MLPRLVTIPISHYGERARWALDHAGVAYREAHHLQVFSWVAAYRLGGHKTLPVLVTDAGTLTDSAAIVRWASDRAAASLYPVAPAGQREVARLEQEFAGEYGVEARRIVYEWFARRSRALFGYNAGRAPAVQVHAMRAVLPLARAVLVSYLQAKPAEVARGRVRVARVMDAVAARLADGRQYLVGERFTAADLAFAAMSAPLVLPAQYGTPLPSLAELPPDAAAYVQAVRDHPAGRFALRLYSEHRTSSPLRVW